MIVTMVLFLGGLWGPLSHDLLTGADPLDSKLAAKQRPSEWRAFVIHMDYGLPLELTKMSKRERLALELRLLQDAAK